MENMTIKRRAAGFGLEWPGDSVAASLLEGGNRSILGILGGGNRGHFGTVRTISTVPLDATSQQHHNQLVATTLAWAETAGGRRGGFAFRRGESMYLGILGGCPRRLLGH